MPRRRTRKTEGGGGPLRAVATLIDRAKPKVKEEEEDLCYINLSNRATFSQRCYYFLLKIGLSRHCANTHGSEVSMQFQYRGPYMSPFWRKPPYLASLLTLETILVGKLSTIIVQNVTPA